VPEDILKLDTKYRHLMARRSKAKQRIATAKDPVKKDEYEQLWKQLDEAVNLMKSKLNERRKGT